MRTIEELSDIEEFLIQGCEQAVEQGQTIKRSSSCACALAVQFDTYEKSEYLGYRRSNYLQAADRIGLNYVECREFISGFDMERPLNLPGLNPFYLMGVRMAQRVCDLQGWLEA